MDKVLIAMSGGVDSSVAAFLMKEQGCECIGATMKLFHNEDIGVSRTKTCCSLEDVEDARLVALRLRHPLLCLQLFRRLQGAGHRPLHLVLRARRDAKPLHRLQPLPEV